VHSHYLC